MPAGQSRGVADCLHGSAPHLDEVDLEDQPPHGEHEDSGESGEGDDSESDSGTVYVQLGMPASPSRQPLMHERKEELACDTTTDEDDAAHQRPVWTHQRELPILFFFLMTKEIWRLHFDVPGSFPPSLGGSCALTQHNRIPTLAELDDTFSSSFDAMSLLSA